jgi:hypothetical protein
VAAARFLQKLHTKFKAYGGIVNPDKTRQVLQYNLSTYDFVIGIVSNMDKQSQLQMQLRNWGQSDSADERAVRQVCLVWFRH